MEILYKAISSRVFHVITKLVFNWSISFLEMMSTILILAIMAFAVSGQNSPSTDTYLLANLIPDLLNEGNDYMFDGPDYITHAPTIPTTTRLPTLDQMMYYNYYAASMYCPYQLSDLSCLYCQKFKKDVYAYKVLTNDTMNTVALVTASKSLREIVVSYRGTSNIWNVILDLTTINANYPGGPVDIKIHRGFYIATMSLYDQIVRYVRYLRGLFPNYKIVVTGQSLGAAMARVTEYFLICLNQFPGATYEVYTYGEPRVGNKAFADFINKQINTTARIVDRADIVPHVPPTSLLTTTILGDYYIHPQTEYWINGNYSRFCDQSVYEDPTCSDSLGPAYSVLDHGTYFDANYVICVADQPLAHLSIPFDVLEPVETIPPLPTKVTDLLDPVIDLIVIGISPPLGR